MKKILYLLCIMIVISCKNKLEHATENWKFIDIKIDSNCKFYIMHFIEGDYMFRVSSSGSCESLTSSLFLKKYDEALKNHKNEISIKSGKMVFNSFEQDTNFANKLAAITNFHFKRKVKIIENSDRIILQLDPE
ncbi:hypothetical protein [Flavobacterium sp.]|uniref:hypothetical protein n=1 Tax=Flavobacterium sp. TaxID=239 RepID=UPI0039E28CFA